MKYSITELELFGICVNVCQFKHLLAKVDFDCTVDHSALTYIMKSKSEAASARIKQLMEVLSAYLFILYNMKGKGMILGDLYLE